MALGLIYLDQVGLPGPFKRMLVDNLRARGLDLQFSRLRLRWYEGVVAENVRFGRADEPSSPHLTVAEARVQVNWRALLHRPVLADALVNSLVLRQGRLVWPLVETNRAPRSLALEDINTELRFLPEDQWALEHFTAGFAGGKVELAARIAHASAVGSWKFAQPSRAAPAGSVQKQLRSLADTLEHVQFSAAPRLVVDVRGDARDLPSFKVRVLLNASGLSTTPWGALWEGRCMARLSPVDTNGWQRAELNLAASGADTPWAAATNLHLSVRLASLTHQPDRIDGELVLHAGKADTAWAQAEVIRLEAKWVHSLTNPVPVIGQGQFRCEQAHTPWATARSVSLGGGFSTRPAGEAAHADAAWAWWTNLAPYRVDWECRIDGAQASGLELDQLACGGQWLAPELVVTNLQAQLGRSRIDFRARMDVATRTLALSLDSRVDPCCLAPLFSAPLRRELTNCSWTELPRLQAEAGWVWPAWHSPGGAAGWSDELLPSLWARGRFSLAAGAAYRDIALSGVYTSFVYSNGCCRLPDLIVTRPEGRLEADCRFAHQFRELDARLSSTIDWRLIRPLLDEDGRDGVDLLAYTQPPGIEGELWCRFEALERTGFRGGISLTNFSFRGETARRLQSAFAYTNGVLECFGPNVERAGGQVLRADGLKADFPADVIILTNGYSTAEPRVVTRAIGAHVDRVVAPYRFSQPPVAHVYGVIPLHGEAAADLHFELEGGPFHWWKFNVPHLAGHVHWRGKSLTISEVRADFYDGQATGQAAFDFSPARGDSYQFSLATTNTLLQALMADLSSKTNVLEGRLSGSLVITHANTADDQILEGHGQVHLQDGLIWDIPVFGVFSPVLDGLVPGLGHSRASAATGTFVITNAIIYSDDLQIRSTAMRLAYRGTVDLNQRVNARVEAELLRDVPLVGPLARMVLLPVTKLFEYKVTGTLDEPKTVPVYFVPKVLLLPFQFPFHPWRTLKGLLPDQTSAPGTFSPP